ncbi:MAG TPA: hypothetical protein VK610_10245 [Rhodothermales bacterium]|nr:hypothetical protein [Rhodothermales bacterium]
MNRTEILDGYVTDMAAVENHILSAAERQVAAESTARYPEAKAPLEALAAVLRQHVAALKAYNGETPSEGTLAEVAKEALTDVIGFAAGIYDQLRQEDRVSRMVRDTYTALGLATVSYHMLHTTALGLKEHRLADLAIAHLRDLTPHAVELSKAVCLVVAHELADEDKTLDPNVGPEAVRRTHEAWEAAGSGTSGGDGGATADAAVRTIGANRDADGPILPPADGTGGHLPRL